MCDDTNRENVALFVHIIIFIAAIATDMIGQDPRKCETHRKW